MANYPSIMLFGSTARGDQSPNSDIDILIVEEKGIPRALKDGIVEIHYNQKNQLLKKAEAGDLFAIHLAFEGKSISDPTNFFVQFKDKLKIKSDYSAERQEAYLLAGFLCLKQSFLADNNEFLNRRIAWCVRTVLISILIEQGKFIFSPNGLKDEYSHLELASLLDLRRSEENISAARDSVKYFLDTFNANRWLDLSPAEYFSYAKTNKMHIALNTMKKTTNSSENLGY